MKTTTKKKAGKGLNYFGLIFVAIGLGVGLFMLGGPVLTAMEARDWVPVQAQVLDSNLRVNRGSDSTTYRVEARYRYTYDGRAYTGDRVSLHKGSDNIGDYHQRWHSRLAHAQRNNQRLTAWVNPADPTEALLDRELRWPLMGFMSIFAIVFTGAGLFFTFLGRFTQRRAERDLHGRPVIRDRGLAPVWTFGFMTAMFALLPLPGLLAIPKELARDNYPILLVLLFPLAALWLGYMLVKAYLGWRRFGMVELWLDPHPGQVGGPVAGTITFQGRLSSQDRVQAQLLCKHVRITGSGKNRRRSETILWERTQTLVPLAAGRGTQLQFRFETPAGLPASEEPSRNYHEWELHLLAEVPGVDLDRNLAIPVEANAMPLTGGLRPDPRAILAEDPGAPIPARVARLSSTGTGLTLHYPASRLRGMGLVTLLFGLLFLLAPALLWGELLEDHRSLFDWAGGLFGLVFALVGLGLVLGGVFLAGNTLTVAIRNGELFSRRSLLGLARTRHVHLDDIERIEMTTGGSSTQGTRRTVYYRLHAHTRDGRRIVLGDGIPGSALAERLKTELETALAG